MSVRIEFDHFTDIAASSAGLVKVVVQKTVFDLEGQAKVNAPVRTGNLKNSIQGQMTGETEGEVTVGAEYGAYVNYGTYKMVANPFFDRAVAAVEPAFQDAMTQLARKDL